MRKLMLKFESAFMKEIPLDKQGFTLGSTGFVGWPSCLLMAGVWLPCMMAAWLLSHAGASVAAVATLAEAAAALDGAIDIVDVFRRPELTEEVAREAAAVGARALWLQLGVINWDAVRIAADAGLSVVMDRCTAIELRRLPPG